MSKIPVVLNVQGVQRYQDQEPEIIELTTEGTMERQKEVWVLSYEESDLTGLAGVTTLFRLEPGQVILQRSGKLRSEMVFREGVSHESLYQMEFGALMLTVCAKQIEANISQQGGTIDLVYSVQIEHTEAGMVEYHLEIRPKA